MKTLLVTGGNGLLGNKILALKHEKYHIISVDLHDDAFIIYSNVTYQQADICQKDSMFRLMDRFNPGCVIHTAALTNVDGCEQDHEKAWRINVEGTRNVVLGCAERNIQMIHLSTDYVFDGRNGPYRETDSPNPISVYGKTKLESEHIVKQYLPKAVIARTMVLYGFVPFIRENFVTWIVNRLKRGEDVHIVDDQFGTPTLADNLVNMIIALYANNGSGLYHTAGKDCLSRYDFALKIAQVFDLNFSLIHRTQSHFFHQPAPRPLKSGLKSDKIYHEMGISITSIQEGLEIVKNQMDQYEKSVKR